MRFFGGAQRRKRGALFGAFGRNIRGRELEEKLGHVLECHHVLRRASADAAEGKDQKQRRARRSVRPSKLRGRNIEAGNCNERRAEGRERKGGKRWKLERKVGGCAGALE